MENKKYLPIALLVLLLVVVFTVISVRNFGKNESQQDGAENNEMQSEEVLSPKSIDKMIEEELADGAIDFMLYSNEDSTNSLGEVTITENQNDTTILIKMNAGVESDTPQLVGGFCDSPEDVIQDLSMFENGESFSTIKFSIKELTMVNPVIVKTSNACGSVRIF